MQLQKDKLNLCRGRQLKVSRGRLAVDGRERGAFMFLSQTCWVQKTRDDATT